MLIHTTFLFRQRNRGGAIYNRNSLTLDHCTISGCTAGNGGAIANDKSLTISKSTISSNLARSEGGGIDCAGNVNCVTSLTNTVVTGNPAGVTGAVAGKGGGIALLANATLTVAGGAIIGNQAVGGSIGGGVYSSGGVIGMQDCILSNNSADFGGGIYCAGTSVTTITGGTIGGNSATNWGGAFYLEPQTSLTLTDIAFGTNTAGVGGPLVAYKGIRGRPNATVFITVTNCTGIIDPADIVLIP